MQSEYDFTNAKPNPDSENQTVLPEPFIKRLQAIIPTQHQTQVLASFAIDKNPHFWLNTLKAGPTALTQQLQNQELNPEPISWLAQAFKLPLCERPALLASELWQQSLCYVQNPSSWLAPWLLAPSPNDKVLDLTAAPGGKTLLLARMMDNQGEIAAVEAVKERFHKLNANLKHYGATNVRTFHKDGGLIWRHRPEYFDKILLDAPCSSEARFSTHEPKSFSFWSEKKIQDMQRKQVKLLSSAWQCLKPGGELLYCTCSFAPEENEFVINKLLKRQGNSVQIKPIELPITNWQAGLSDWAGKPFSAELNKARRILPNEDYSGFFLCLLQKH